MAHDYRRITIDDMGSTIVRHKSYLFEHQTFRGLFVGQLGSVVIRIAQRMSDGFEFRSVVTFIMVVVVINITEVLLASLYPFGDLQMARDIQN